MPALDARPGRRLAALRSEVRHPDLERKVGRAAREDGFLRVEVRRVDPVRVALEPLHELSGAGRPLARVRGAGCVTLEVGAGAGGWGWGWGWG